MQTVDQVLSAVNYPTTVVTLDLETYQDDSHSLSKLTVYEYLADPAFEILALAEKTGEADPYISMGDVVSAHLGALQHKWGKNFEGCTVSFHNASFDATILAVKFGIHPKYVIDTVSLARAWNSKARAGLGEVAKWFNLPEKGETKTMTGWSFRDRWTPGRTVRGKRKPPTLRPTITEEQTAWIKSYAANDVNLQWSVLKELLPRLSNPVIELALQAHTLRLYTQPVLGFDRALAAKLQDEMGKQVSDAVALANVERETISGNHSFEGAMQAALLRAGDHLMNYTKLDAKGKMVLAISKTDDALVLLLKHPAEEVRNLINARIAVKSLPLHVSRVASMASMSRAAGDLLPVPLKFMGAHTGRFSGSEGINLQNLPKKSAIRGLITAQPGHKLVVADLAAIEARVLAWVADQHDLVELFRTNADPYSDFASRFYGVAVRKPAQDEIPAIAKRLTAYRQMGKVAILGCGYGMGATHFAEFASCDETTAKQVIDLYRKTNQAIVAYWRAVETAFVRVAKYHAPIMLPHGVSFSHTDEVDVVMGLPCGRRLNYNKVRMSDDGIGIFNAMTKSWDRTWGGSLVENLVQAASRDVLAEAFLRIEAHGYRVPLHVHDEVVIHCPAEKADDALTVALEELCRTPAWAPGLPLGAEGGIMERYSKG
jgi:hypothetical protein